MTSKALPRAALAPKRGADRCHRSRAASLGLLFAGHRIPGLFPGLETALHVHRVLVAEVVHGLGRQRRPEVVHSIEDDPGLLVGDDLVNMEVEEPP